MKTDIEIARDTLLLPIKVVAETLNIDEDNLEYYGKYKAKVNLCPKSSHGKLILVTAISPTKYGEGKTTVSIGLADGIARLGHKVALALREPSLGPVFGIKGGATGGGYAQVAPMEDINLHFTGDMHAITSANNLIAAALDNHIFQGNDLEIDTTRIVFNRCMDMNDRALRTIQCGLATGNDRFDRFDITAASEVMAIICLSSDMEDLKERIGRIVLAYNKNGLPVTASDINVVDGVAILLKNALKPNLVQTLEGTPAFIHGGPFANIAHGCNSIIATKLAMGLAEYVVTEAGFGAELGAEKFIDIKCRTAGIRPSAVVLVATLRALKYNGGALDATVCDIDALKRGLVNLNAHIENLKNFGCTPIVAINRFEADTDEEIAIVNEECTSLDVVAVPCTAFTDGGIGAMALARAVINTAREIDLTYAYDLADSIRDKIEKLAKRLGASSVEYSEEASKMIEDITYYKGDKCAVCLAKTQYSLSDDPALLGRPTNFKLKIQEVSYKGGAGFVVVKAGNILLMPGLPKNPAFLKMSINNKEEIMGLF